MKKREVVTLTALAFSVGMITGFLVAPIKKGIININGNNFRKEYIDLPNKPEETKDDSSLS